MAFIVAYFPCILPIPSRWEEIKKMSEQKTPTTIMKDWGSGDSVFMMVFYPFGSRNEHPEQRGGMHVLEHMVFQGVLARVQSPMDEPHSWMENEEYITSRAYRIGAWSRATRRLPPTGTCTTAGSTTTSSSLCRGSIFVNKVLLCQWYHC